MSTRLDRITNWPELARQANWSAAGLAQDCGVTIRTLERHFLREMGVTPREWLVHHRMPRARELLANGSTVKETAAELGYKNQHHFAREFKKHYGYCPSATYCPSAHGVTAKGRR